MISYSLLQVIKNWRWGRPGGGGEGLREVGKAWGRGGRLGGGGEGLGDREASS